MDVLVPLGCRTKPNRANLMFTVYFPPPHKLLEMFGCRIVGIWNKNPCENWKILLGILYPRRFINRCDDFLLVIIHIWVIWQSNRFSKIWKTKIPWKFNGNTFSKKKIKNGTYKGPINLVNLPFQNLAFQAYKFCYAVFL